MEDFELLDRLKKHEAFGVSTVQRIASFGYQRAVDTINRLEAGGVIQANEASSQWNMVSPKAELLALYEQRKTALQEFENLPSQGVEPLILMDVPKGWAGATNRVLIVGQETLGWDFAPGDYYECSGQLIPDTTLIFFSA